MRRLMCKLTCSRTFHLALGVAWLPYILMRCQDNPTTHEDCGMMRAHDEEGVETGEHHHARGAMDHHDAVEHRAVEHGQTGHRHDSGPAHTCCQATGKYNVTVASIVPLAPPVLLVTLPAPGASIGWQRGIRWSSRAVPVAHGPPSYILHSTLLI